MGVIKDDGSPWTGPGFDFGAPKGPWPEATSKRAGVAVDDMNTAIEQALRRADTELLEEDGTGEYLYVGKEEY